MDNLENQAARLSAHADNFTLDKLQHEIREYREILKCTVCHDRQKEVCHSINRLQISNLSNFYSLFSSYNLQCLILSVLC